MLDIQEKLPDSVKDWYDPSCGLTNLSRLHHTDVGLLFLCKLDDLINELKNQGGKDLAYKVLQNMGVNYDPYKE
jgi:hypothetical protein